MRVAVISDIHGNLHALEAVLAALAGESLDEVWALGDTVGYGPRPNPCCLAVESHADLCLAGNHDLGVLGKVGLEAFSPDAAASALWTRGVLSDRSRSLLESFEPTARRDGAELYHASPTDPVWDYILSVDAALEALELTSESIVLVGHTHLPMRILLADGNLSGGLAPAGTEVDLSAGRWLLNPGSVGQPRDGDPRAGYLLIDFGSGIASFRRAEYAVERTQTEIHERGLPDALGERLARGV